MSHDGRIAVVTGGALGIGRAICERLARDGAKVAIWDIDLAGAGETARLIEAAGGTAKVYPCNVAVTAEIAEAARRTREDFGPIAILVNNAAMTGSDKFEDISEELWERMLRIDLTGPFLCIQQVLPDMLDKQWGRIVNITSSSVQRGGPFMAHYVAAKGGLLGLTRGLATEYASRGITVNNVPPGFVETPTMRKSQQAFVGGGAPWEDALARMPMKRAGKPEELAAAVAFLASDDAAYITGHTLSVNGGLYVH
jgi:2-hydroxycyclohexanecarboxyl-CoA dehydrogenase